MLVTWVSRDLSERDAGLPLTAREKTQLPVITALSSTCSRAGTSPQHVAASRELSSNCIFIRFVSVVNIPHPYLKMLWTSCRWNCAPDWDSLEPMVAADFDHVTMRANECCWFWSRDLIFCRVGQGALRTNGRRGEIGMMIWMRLILLIRLSFWCSCFQQITTMLYDMLHSAVIIFIS